MYTVVLLAALTTGAEAPDCHWGWGGGGGYYSGWGGYGGYYGGGFGCYGGWGGYGGYYGGDCYAGYGGYTTYSAGNYVNNGYYVTQRASRKTTTATVRANVPRIPAPGRLVVTVPADAKLKVGDQVMKTTGARRVFLTRPLKQGKGHTLTLEASVEREGQTITWQQQVTVRALHKAEVTMTVPAASVAAR